MDQFFIKNRAGEDECYTEEEFHARIMDDAVRNRYDWRVPITEIVRVVPTFSKKHRDDIYRAVLDCFYHIQAEHKINLSNQAAIWKCFLGLGGDTEEDRKLKEFYASRHVENAIVCGPPIFHMHYGETWRNFLKAFRETKGQEWRGCTTPEELQAWSDSLEGDLIGKLEAAEEAGVFELDDAKGMDDIIKMVFATRNIDDDRAPDAFLWDLRLS